MSTKRRKEIPIKKEEKKKKKRMSTIVQGGNYLREYREKRHMNSNSHLLILDAKPTRSFKIYGRPLWANFFQIFWL
jgi:hypothetical protein